MGNCVDYVVDNDVKMYGWVGRENARIRRHAEVGA
jgi:hypothetical protein